MAGDVEPLAGTWALERRAERRSRGAAARVRVPHALHATWQPAPERPDPILLLEQQDAMRLPQLVPVRHARMAVSPLTFYRGAALQMAADLSASPTSGLAVQACGDAHLSNFGLFASPERDLLFDVNDFDETLPGPWEWDVKRLAGSLVVAARTIGCSAHEARHAALAAVRAYQERMAEYAAMRAIDIYYARVDAGEILDAVAAGARHLVATTVKSAAHHDALHVLPRLTEIGADGRRRIVDHPPTTFHHPEVDRVREAGLLEAYATTLQEDRVVLLRRYGIVDAAIKVVGVGSVGLLAGVILLDGGDGDDPLFLQLKEAIPSVLERTLPTSTYAHHGERVVAGQRRLQAASDVLLGWTTGAHGKHFYVRQLQDQKAGAMVDEMKPADLEQWGRLCAWALARGHARSGDPVAIDAYLGEGATFAHAVAVFAGRYADQTEQDHAALMAAIRSGRIAAETGA